MARRLFMVQNGAMPTTARMPVVATGTAIKTMLQVKPTTPIVVVEWGFSFDVAPAALVTVELLTTGTVAGTGITEYTANDITKWDDSGAAASGIDTATDKSGFTATAEGTITATRVLDYLATWAQSYSKQWPLDREPMVPATDYLRIRATTATTIGMNCWVIFEE